MGVHLKAGRFVQGQGLRGRQGKSAAQEIVTMKVAFLLIASVLLWANNAFAYLDPGTGSIIIQSVIALAIGALITVKGYWSRIKSWFNNKKLPAEKKSR